MSKLGKRIIIICVTIIICTLLYMLVQLVYKINIVQKNAKAYHKFITSDNYKYVCENSSRNYGQKKYEICKKGDKLKTYTENYINVDGDNRIEKYTVYIQGKSEVYVNEETKTFSIYSNAVEDYSIYIRSLDRATFSQIKYYIQSKEKFFEKVKNILWVLSNALPDEIISEEYDGKECYKCTYINKYKQSKKYTNIVIEETYIDKETFLPVCLINNIYEKGDNIRKLAEENIKKVSYDFDVVTDSDVELPDLTEYSQTVSTATY